MLGPLGRQARRAELPPADATPAEATIQQTAAAHPPAVAALMQTMAGGMPVAQDGASRGTGRANHLIRGGLGTQHRLRTFGGGFYLQRTPPTTAPTIASASPFPFLEARRCRRLSP